MPHLFRVEVNMVGIGRRGEKIVGDPVLWAEHIEAGFVTDLGVYETLTDDGEA